MSEAILVQRVPKDERPRERCLETGPGGLSLRECLALILGSGPKGHGCLGLASKILQRAATDSCPEDQARAFFNALEISSQAFLAGIPGLGKAGICRILSAFEIGRRYALFREGQAAVVFPLAGKRSGLADLRSRAVGKISVKLRGASQEWFGFVPVYNDRKLGEFCLVERGARTHVNIDPLELFARILPLRPSGVFLFHNHPSGNLDPSQEDLLLTEEASAVLRTFRIEFLGHAIVTSVRENWMSG